MINFRSKDYTTEYAYNLYKVFKIGKLEMFHYQPGYSHQLTIMNHNYPCLIVGLFGYFLILRYK